MIVEPLIAAALATATAAGQPIDDFGPEIEGVWLTVDRTRIVDIGADTATVYDRSAVLCLESEHIAREALKSIYSHVVTIGVNRILFWDEGETTAATRLDALPAACADDPPEATPAALAEAMTAYFAESYPSFAARNVDREGFLRRLRGLSGTQSDAFWIEVKDLFRELDDAHLFVTNDAEGEARRSAMSAAPSGLRAVLADRTGRGGYVQARERIGAAHDALIQDEVLGGVWRAGGNGKLIWGWARSGLAYVRMPALTGWTTEQFETIAPYVPIIAAEMDRVIADIGEADAVILDIRGNRGGNDMLMHTIAAYFLSAPATYRWRRPMPDGWGEWRDVRVEPADNALSVPVYLLVDRNTVSSGELIALLLRQNEDVVTIGEATRGAVSSLRVVQLPGGGFMGMPYQQVARADGFSPEGGGITPDILVPSFPDGRLISGYRDAIDRAVALYESGGAPD